MNKYRIYSLAVIIWVLGGCAGQSGFDYHDASDIPEGPGMFTEGAAVISFKDSPPAKYGGAAGPTEFLQWKKVFEQASEHQKYEMWLELQRN